MLRFLSSCWCKLWVRLTIRSTRCRSVGLPVFLLRSKFYRQLCGSSMLKVSDTPVELMEEILHQLIGSLSHYLQGFIHPRWCRISSIKFHQKHKQTTTISKTKTETTLWGSDDPIFFSMRYICFLQIGYLVTSTTRGKRIYGLEPSLPNGWLHGFGSPKFVKAGSPMGFWELAYPGCSMGLVYLPTWNP